MESEPSCNMLPSSETTKKYISIPPLEEGSHASQILEQGGKWMVYLNGNLDLLDRYWESLKPLLDDGTLSMIRATSSLDPTGLISCYTPHADDVDKVRWAADEIRRRTSYDRLMYYKTNQSTVDGKFLEDGCRFISKYMHTVSCGLYRKDMLQRWMIVPRQP